MSLSVLVWNSSLFISPTVSPLRYYIITSNAILNYTHSRLVDAYFLPSECLRPGVCACHLNVKNHFLWVVKFMYRLLLCCWSAYLNVFSNNLIQKYTHALHAFEGLQVNRHLITLEPEVCLHVLKYTLILLHLQGYFI